MRSPRSRQAIQALAPRGLAESGAGAEGGGRKALNLVTKELFNYMLASSSKRVTSTLQVRQRVRALRPSRVTSGQAHRSELGVPVKLVSTSDGDRPVLSVEVRVDL